MTNLASLDISKGEPALVLQACITLSGGRLFRRNDMQVYDTRNVRASYRSGEKLTLLRKDGKTGMASTGGSELCWTSLQQENKKEY